MWGKVGQVGVEDAPLAAVRRARRAVRRGDELPYDAMGRYGDAELATDPHDRRAGGVVTLYRVVERVSPRPDVHAPLPLVRRRRECAVSAERERRRCLSRCLGRCRGVWRGRQSPESRIHAREPALGDVPDIRQQMPPIRDVPRVRCHHPRRARELGVYSVCTQCVLGRAVARDHRHARAPAALRGEGRPRAVRQQIDDAVLLEIDEDGAGDALLVRPRRSAQSLTPSACGVG